MYPCLDITLPFIVSRYIHNFYMHVQGWGWLDSSKWNTLDLGSNCCCWEYVSLQTAMPIPADRHTYIRTCAQLGKLMRLFYTVFRIINFYKTCFPRELRSHVTHEETRESIIYAPQVDCMCAISSDNWEKWLRYSSFSRSSLYPQAMKLSCQMLSEGKSTLPYKKS